MKKYLTHILIFSFLISFSQNNKKISVNYKTISLIDIDALKKDPNMDPIKLKYIEKIKKSFENTEYILNIDAVSNSSFFESVMKLDPPNTSGLLYSTNSNQKFYVDSELYIEQVDGLGEKYLIVEPNTNLDWDLSKETKEILGYTCYKANFNKEREGLKSIKIEAWYAPELSYQFGPKGYYGLPGLILEIKQNEKLIITASNINFDAKIFVFKPTKGKKISQSGIDSLLQSAAKEFKSQYKN